MSETAPAAASPEGVKPRRSRAEWSVFGLGFASGLPYAILVGSLGVWIANAGLSFSVIGALSWIGLFYAFKFIWAPAFDWLVPPFANTVGRRRAWMAMCQVVVALGLFGMTFVDPRDNIVMFALFAVLAGFASASQDIVIDAWRIETAEDQKMLDRMSVQYQMGYRLAALLGGIAALLLTDMWRTAADAAAGWPPTMIILSIMMAVAALTATWMAPEPLFRPPVTSEPQDADTHSLRRRTAIPVAAGWALSALLLLGFMFYTLANPSANAVVFRDAATPWILLLTIGAPLALSFWLVKRKPGVIEAPMQRGSFFDAMFERVLAPMADVVRRYWLWALPILLLAMTYRIADSIWGSFAQPFYVRILGYSNSDLAVAQKLVGVAMTMGGIALGGLGVKLLGRVNALILGAVLAAVTNLLYVDLAYGGAWADGFLQVTGLGSFLSWVIGGLVGWVNSTGATVFAAVNPGQAINRLTVVIAMENLAGGFASAVHLVWLSSIVNKRYAAVQYALFGSLALLIGVIFRPKIGEYVDAVKDAGLQAQAARFADVFNLAMYIGFFAVALCVVELYRQAQEKKRLAAAGLAPVAAE